MLQGERLLVVRSMVVCMGSRLVRLSGNSCVNCISSKEECTELLDGCYFMKVMTLLHSLVEDTG